MQVNQGQLYDLSMLTKGQQKALQKIILRVVTQMQSKRAGRIEINFASGGVPVNQHCIEVECLTD